VFYNRRQKANGVLGFRLHISILTHKSPPPPTVTIAEVALGKPYNATCDTYSFSILLWEMLALNTPYAIYTIAALRERVYVGEEKRPSLNGNNWSNSLKDLFEKSWTSDHKKRLAMADVEDRLREECVNIRCGNDAGLEHERRRSTFVFLPGKGGGEKLLGSKHSMFLGSSFGSRFTMDV